MSMLIKIAWKNIWRNRTRSAILITAVSLGIWALVFINGVAIGMVSSYIESAILKRTSHIQIHLPQYVDEPDITYYFNGTSLRSYLDTAVFVREYSPRIVTNGMISSATSSRGITLYGVDPSRENALTSLEDQLEEGEYLPPDGGNFILIGDNMADKLGVRVRSRVVVNFQNADGVVTAAAFRVAGIFGGQSSLIGEDIAYAHMSTIRKLSGLTGSEVHEIAMLVKQPEMMESNQEDLATAFDDLSVRNYKEIAPDVALMGSQINISLTVMTTIFMLALIFGIINTMLMAVLERYREIGMLLAVGMKKFQVFSMVVWETVFLSMIGVPIGLFLGYLTILWTQNRGINLERWSDSLKEFGLTSVIYPNLYPRQYIIIALAVLVTAIVAALYPARKATSLKPIEALRKI